MNKTGLAISGVLIAVIIVVAAWQLSATGTDSTNETNTYTVEDETINVDDQQMNDEEMMDEKENADDEQAVSGTLYADGTYEAVGGYNSPAGKEEISVSLTLEDDVVVATSMEVLATNPTSKLLQKRFQEGYEAEVIGKTIDDLSLTVVNGSSLTPEGFNAAVEEIKKEALEASK